MVSSLTVRSNSRFFLTTSFNDRGLRCGSAKLFVLEFCQLSDRHANDHFIAFADRAFARYPSVPRRFKLASLLCAEDPEIRKIGRTALACEQVSLPVSHIDHGQWYRSGFRMGECAAALNCSRAFISELEKKGLLLTNKCKEGQGLFPLECP